LAWVFQTKERKKERKQRNTHTLASQRIQRQKESHNSDVWHWHLFFVCLGILTTNFYSAAIARFTNFAQNFPLFLARVTVKFCTDMSGLVGWDLGRGMT